MERIDLMKNQELFSDVMSVVRRGIEMMSKKKITLRFGGKAKPTNTWNKEINI